MGQRLRALGVVVVLVGVGALAGSAFSQWRGPADATSPGGAAPAEGGVGAPAERVRVEVLNGGGRADMARRATEHLRGRGFDVVYYGNADTFGHDSTVVLDRVGRPELARAVAGALGRTPAAVVSETDTTRFVDVSVVLGAAWEPPAGTSPPARDEVGRPAWWDLRRFLPDGDGAPAHEGGTGHMADPVTGGG